MIMNDMNNWWDKELRAFIKASGERRLGPYIKIFKSRSFKEQFGQASGILNRAIRKDKKILFFGNGGSAAEAQHGAAELVCQFKKKRKAVPAMALTVDTSILTAQSNDFGFESVFERQIEAFCNPGDVVIGMTTSDYSDYGHSQNIHLGFLAARKKQAETIGLFSLKTQNLLDWVKVAIIVPSTDTDVIQEAHLMIIHMLCERAENELLERELALK